MTSRWIAVEGGEGSGKSTQAARLASPLGAVLTRDPHWAILWISVSLSGLAAAAPVGWSIPALIAPRGATASVGSIMNFMNNLMGIAAPIATGAIVAVTHSFAGAFFLAGTLLVAGIASYVFLLGDIAPIPDPPAATGRGP